MNIATIAIGISIILYLLVALNCLIQKDYTHAGAWFFYSMANVCFFLYELDKIK